MANHETPNNNWKTKHLYLWHTPWKINMEPTNHPFWKEHDLPNLHDCVPCWFLRGVHSSLAVSSSPVKFQSDQQFPTAIPPEVLTWSVLYWTCIWFLWMQAILGGFKVFWIERNWFNLTNVFQMGWNHQLVYEVCICSLFWSTIHGNWRWSG